jgi:glyoxylase-like metal-dependent hydrolase (beta-lactamase superfamily II)
MPLPNLWSLLVLLLLSVGCAGAPNHLAPPAQRSELEYLKAVNAAAPPQDPQLLFLLMGSYANAALAGEGAEFFEARLAEFGPRLSDVQRALYLGAIGALRAQHAARVPLLQRTAWVEGTIAKLEQARQLSGGQVFVLRWISGVIYARLPDSFGQRASALADLEWCVQHADAAPHAGWLREVYFGLASAEHATGNEARARTYLAQSGYDSFDKPLTLTTPYSEQVQTGHTFAPRRIWEPLPGRVYALSGYEFTEYYFVLSRDGQQLFAIDAGTRPDAAKEAYAALHGYAPQLPPLTTVFVTHAHWDHVGGHRYFHSLVPAPKFYARASYAAEIERSLAAPSAGRELFFGARFSADDVRSFQPDVLIASPTELTLGGSRIELLPVRGGETEDALLIHFPEEQLLFAGDILMPYLGAPFLEEGSLPGLLEAIDVVVQKNPKVLLHGHQPLTQLFSSPAVLAALKPHLVWLQREVEARIARGEDRAQIQAQNLISPSLLTGDSAAQLPYLVLRENVINRIFDQRVGYWQPHLEGLDSLGQADYGTLLIDYLTLSEDQVVNAAERLIADGNYELAAKLLAWSEARLGQRPGLERVERSVYLKLMEKNQNTNPFKYILYSGRFGVQTPQLALPAGK